MKKEILYKQLWPTCVFLLLFTFLFGLIYPGCITVINQFLFMDQSFGSLIKVNNEIKGSFLIGQPFSSEKYFLSRPSATMPVPYNAGASSASNLGTANPELKNMIESRIATLLEIDADNTNIIPIDLITASASGLDPHISIASAEYQISRIARARNLNPSKLRYIVYSLVDLRQFALLGEPRVNVLKLNIVLDEISAGRLSAENHGN